MISVIVPTYKREEDVQRCIQSLATHSFYKNEILILTPEITPGLALLGEQTGCRVLPDESRKDGKRVLGLWSIINKGIGLASNDYVCWLNDDCVVLENWDRIALSYFKFRVALVALKARGIGASSDFKVEKTLYGLNCCNYAILDRRTGIRFDDEFGWLHGDSDISLQAVLKHSRKVVGTREALVVHMHKMDENRTSNLSDPRIKIDRQRLLDKWQGYKMSWFKKGLIKNRYFNQ